METNKSVFDSVDTLEDVSIATIASDDDISKASKEVCEELKEETMYEKVNGYTPEVIDCYNSVTEAAGSDSDPIDIAADEYIDSSNDLTDDEDNDLIDIVANI